MTRIYQEASRIAIDLITIGNILKRHYAFAKHVITNLEVRSFKERRSILWYLQFVNIVYQVSKALGFSRGGLRLASRESQCRPAIRPPFDLIIIFFGLAASNEKYLLKKELLHFRLMDAVEVITIDKVDLQQSIGYRYPNPIELDRTGRARRLEQDDDWLALALHLHLPSLAEVIATSRWRINTLRSLSSGGEPPPPTTLIRGPAPVAWSIAQPFLQCSLQ